MTAPLQFGLVGFGNIGTGLVRTLAEQADRIARRVARPIVLRRIADVDTRPRPGVPYDASILVADAALLTDDPEIEAIVELIGGVEPARSIVERALQAGKHVVTANKALLALHGPELLALAAERGVGLLYEAAVGGGIPIIRALQQGLCANAIVSIQGIINGTCNYILTQMEERGLPFELALAEAQARGYAEPDPTFDIQGIDTAHKIAILASLAFGMDIRYPDVWVEGITAIQPIDIRYAREMGYAIKLLGIARQPEPDGPAEVRVHPTLIPQDSQLASVRGVYNGILVHGEPIGPTFYYGQGAGAKATSSAVLSDLMALAADARGFHPSSEARLRIPIGRKNLRPRESLETHYYLRFTVVDRPGTMAKLTAALGDRHISIESIIQHKPGGEDAPGLPGAATVTIVTHRAAEKNVRACLAALMASEICLAEPFVLRVEE